MNAHDLAQQHRAQQRQAAQIATANRAQAQRTLNGAYLGYDATTGEQIFSTPSGDTIRARAINSAALQPGQITPIRTAQGGRGLSDGRHSSS